MISSIVSTRSSHGANDVRGAQATGDQRGSAIEHAVEDLARVLVTFLPSPVTAATSAVTAETAVIARPNGNAAAPSAAAAEVQKALLFIGSPPAALLCPCLGAAGKQGRESAL
jgi:hypothetical protein